MRGRITELENLVMIQLSPEHTDLSKDDYTAYMVLLSNVEQVLSRKMDSYFFGKQADKLIGRHLNQILKECTLMLDKLHGFAEDSGNKQLLRDMAKKTLIASIGRLHSRYSKYIDMHVDVPVCLFCQYAKQIEINAQLMVNAMTRFYVDKNLQAVVIAKMSSLVQRGRGSWHQVRYLETLQCSIMKLCSGRATNITIPLWDLLICSNFNTNGFISYCKQVIDDELAGYFEIRDRYHCLYHYQRIFNCTSNEHKEKRFMHDAPRVKVVLLKYVEAALNMLDRETALVEYNSKPMTSDVKIGVRLEVSISVDVLAYFSRLLLKAGVTSSSKAATLEFLSRNVRTPGCGEGYLSLKSLDAKYRQPVKNTAITMKSILLKLLKQVNEEFE